MAGEKDYKFRLYSGHDLAPIMPLIDAFGVANDLWAYYASLISFELYQVGDSWAVRMVYNDQVMHIPGCSSTFCDIEEFTKVVNAIIPTAAVRTPCSLFLGCFLCLPCGLVWHNTTLAVHAHEF